jgi:hypothetical protein
MRVHSVIPTPPEAVAGGSRIAGQPRLHSKTLHQKHKTK